jgi:hypothetical protein
MPSALPIRVWDAVKKKKEEENKKKKKSTGRRNAVWRVFMRCRGARPLARWRRRRRH